MQLFETKSAQGETTAAISNLVTFFKPRQLLINSNSNSNTKMKHQQVITPHFLLSTQQRLLLFQSVCQFLQHNGFSKSLKKFTKEANIEKESWKSCVLNLEQMCYQFLKSENDAKFNESAIKEKATSQKDGGINHVETVETIKKTKNIEGDELLKSQEKLEETPIGDIKPKKKKKNKSASESSEQIVEENETKPSNEPEDASLSVPNELGKKSKDKKKKFKEESQEKKEETTGEMSEQADVSQDKKKEKSKSKKKKDVDLKIEDSSVEDTEVDNVKEGSKKRKKSSSEEKENGDVGKELLGDSKRRKTDNIDQSNEVVAPKTPNGSSNGILENDERKVSQKEKSKQHNSSSEPRSASNAFRRVKEEEVEFVDERLQDNSYWAKDGADTGYGAKAQEVLGQVRGRGFRHEKTKKKRGSYRGGQIDLQSHSIKFNYDEDDE